MVRPPPPTPPPARATGGKPGTKLFVGGIPEENATVDQIRALFAVKGAVPLEVVVLPPRGSNPDTRCAFVRVPDELAGSACQALNGVALDGHITPLVVRLADKQGPALAGTSCESGGEHAPIKPLHLPSAMNPAEEKRKALAAGRWLEVAKWHEQEFERAEESWEHKFQRLAARLHAAVATRHLYEAAAISEAMAEMDPRGAAIVNTSIASEAHPEASSASSTTVPPPPRAKAGGLWDDAAAGEFVGQIISFGAGRQYGFIQCAELGADAFLSDKQLGAFRVGDLVRFSVSYNAKGQPQAQNLAPAGAALTSPPQKRLRGIV